MNQPPVQSLVSHSPGTGIDPEQAVEAFAGMTLEEVERRHILATLRRHQGNRTTAAAELRVSRRTLHYRLAAYKAMGHTFE